jgi:hypothetical protein
MSECAAERPQNGTALTGTGCIAPLYKTCFSVSFWSCLPLTFHPEWGERKGVEHERSLNSKDLFILPISPLSLALRLRKVEGGSQAPASH